jgi:hypothetical protein
MAHSLPLIGVRAEFFADPDAICCGSGSLGRSLQMGGGSVVSGRTSLVGAVGWPICPIGLCHATLQSSSSASNITLGIS